MKAILEFDLNEEGDEYDKTRHGPALHSALWAVDQHIRNRLKWGGWSGEGSKGLGEEAVRELEGVRKLLNEEVNEIGGVVLQ